MQNKLHVVQVIANLDMGGGQHVVYELVRNLDKNLFDVTVLCFHRVKDKSNSILQDKMIAEGYNIIFCTWKRELSCIQMWHYLSKLKPDIVHCHLTPLTAILWSKIHKVRCLQTIHTKPENALAKKWQTKILSKLVKKGWVVSCAISEYNKKSCCSYWNMPNEKVFFVNNGIDIGKFKRQPHDNFGFINVARQDSNKNQIMILRVFLKFVEKYPTDKIILYLIGDGPENKKLMETAMDFGLKERVIFTGYIDAPSPFLAKSDVYISSAKREGLSLSALEGMASGLPVIATDAGGVKDLAQENGILIPVDDEDAMLDAMEKLYVDKNLWKIKSEASLKKVQEFSVEAMARGYEKIYEKLLMEKMG